MDDAGLDRGPREHRGDTVGQALQPVADQEEHIRHAPVLRVGEHRQPELRRLPTTSPGPDPEDVLVAVQVDPDRGVVGLVAYLAVTDLDHDRVDEHRPLSNGRLHQVVISSTILSVILDTVSLLTLEP